MDAESRQEALETLRSIQDDVLKLLDERPVEGASEEEVARFNRDHPVSSLIAKSLVNTTLLAGVLIDVLEEDVTG